MFWGYKMREICINYIQQHGFFSDRSLNGLIDQQLLNLYVEVLQENEVAA